MRTVKTIKWNVNVAAACAGVALFIAVYQWSGFERDHVEADVKRQEDRRFTEFHAKEDKVLLVSGHGISPVGDEFVVINRSSIEEVARLIHHIDDVIDCWSAGSCYTDNYDARAESIAAVNMIVSDLQHLKALMTQFPGCCAELSGHFEQWIRLPDGHIQEVVLQVIAMQPPRLSMGSTIISTLQRTHNAPLMLQAMKELQRYPELNDEIDGLLMDSLTTGAVYTSRSVAENLMAFLREDNISLYEQLALTLSPRSKKAKLLRQSIARYKMREING